MNRSIDVFTMHGLEKTKIQAYSARISELRHLAADDGYSLSHSSENDFWRFVQFEPQLREGELILIDNGNLRATWQDDKGTHVGLQFLGDGIVQYVIFKKRDPTKLISRVAGRDTFMGIRLQIETFQLQQLLYSNQDKSDLPDDDNVVDPSNPV